jgi:hypothetical protein
MRNKLCGSFGRPKRSASVGIDRRNESNHPASQRTRLDTKAARSMSAADCRTRATELIQTATKIAKVSCTFVPEDRFPSLREVLIYQSQVRDLVILDVQAPLRDLRQGLVEAILFGSGRPIILVPSTARPLAGERAVVVWHATRSPVRALHDALPLLVRGREVVIVSVTDDEEFQADHSGEHVCHHLGRQHIDTR